ncbi:MAG TPA: molybdopterin dinucleotide binding domain-containing protein, partial [Thermoanaerobaculia bacterium]|nr:molybdopterin dinucleotide binding domain-containing protein [Thermoanaerobaculia bacterium]
TVAFDQVWTDTAMWADLVLPATHFLEHDEMSRGYGALVLQRSPAVAAPAGEARSNVEVFAEIGRRLGLSRPGDPETADDLAAALLQRTERMRTELEQDGIASPDCGPAPIQFGDSFPLTPDRKAHLVPEALDREAPYGLYAFQEDPATERYPLALISPATSRTISSTFGQLVRQKTPLEIHPADAEGRGIASGDAVRVWNELGEVRVTARLNPDLQASVVLLPKGMWSRHTDSGNTANALAPDTFTDLGQGACFNDARVEVAKV